MEKAFPVIETEPTYDSYRKVYANTYSVGGMTLRDYFAIRAPEPDGEWLKTESEADRQRNPHNDPYRPPRRSLLELRCAWRYLYADTMIKAREE